MKKKKPILKKINLKTKMDSFVKKIKQLINKLFKLITSKKKNSIIITIIALLIIIIIIIVVNSRRTRSFALNEVYNFAPAEIRELYSNIVEVSCDGDLYFSDLADVNNIDVKNMNKQDLLNYVFSNLDKAELLSNEFASNLITTTANKLFLNDTKLLKEIKDYQYGDYIYNVKNSKIVRTKKECVSKNNYISNLYGYAWDKEKLSVDVNIGYLKEGILYDLDNKKMGAYDGNASKLFDLFDMNTYYRFNYVKDGNNIKLTSVELKRKV